KPAPSNSVGGAVPGETPPACQRPAYRPKAALQRNLLPDVVRQRLLDISQLGAAVRSELHVNGLALDVYPRSRGINALDILESVLDLRGALFRQVVFGGQDEQSDRRHFLLV